MWLHDLESLENKMPFVSKIALQVESATLLNKKSQSELGDKTLRFDDVEVVLTRSNGALKK